MNDMLDAASLMPPRDDEGCLVDPRDWNEAVAHTLAHEAGLQDRRHAAPACLEHGLRRG